ncbi:MAG: hypothetical protein COA42_04560 [Alteromonadaceae bacterium]|nr:MAG: hypothetical protein COA42_04560 [Alteromonadaceae bacterium]
MKPKRVNKRTKIYSANIYNLCSLNVCLLAISFFIVAANAFASIPQQQSPIQVNALAKVKLNKIETPELTSIGGILAMAQDGEGFLWFGGRNGLLRYDGYEFKAYQHHPEQSGTLNHNFVTSLLFDSQQRLWVGSHQGLNLYDPIQDRFTSISASHPELEIDTIEALYEDAEKSLWITTSSVKVYRYWRDEDRLEIHDLSRAESSGDRAIYAMLALRQPGADSSMWFGVSGGLIRYDPSSGGKLFFPLNDDDQNTVDNYVRSLHHLPSQTHGEPGIFWVGTDQGLRLFDLAQQDFVNSELPHLKGTTVRAIVADASGKHWLTSDGGGLTVYEPSSKKYEIFDQSRGFINNKVITLLVDRSGSVWAGHYPSGVSVLHPLTISANILKGAAEGGRLTDSDVLALAEDHNGDLWVGTENGLNRIAVGSEGVINSNKVNHYRHKGNAGNSLPASAVTAISVSSDTVLLGTWMGGLSELNMSDSIFRHFPAASSRISPQFIFRDSQARLWLGYNEGLSVIDPVIGLQKPMYYFTALSMIESKNGFFWVGGTDAVYQLDKQGGLIKTFSVNSEIANNLPRGDIFGLLEDDKGDLWLGSKGGLLRLKKGASTFDLFTKSDGLLNPEVSCIVEQDARYLWLATSKGLTRFDREAQVFYHLTQANGLAGDQHKRNTCLKRRNGQLVFGSTKGLTMFKPGDVHSSLNSSAVVLTHVSVLGEEENGPSIFRGVDEISLSYKQSSFALQFSALNFSEPENVRYSFLLEGHDTQWSPLSSNRKVNYLGLSPGEYTFKIKAMYPSGIWSPSKSVLITLASPWWLSRVVYLVYALVLLLLLGALYVFGKKWRRHREQILIMQKKSAAEAKLKQQEQEKLAVYAKKVSLFFETSKPYLDPDLSLGMLSKFLGLPGRDISTAINKHLHSSFAELVSGYRVKEAKRLLESDRKKSITDVMLEAGFNSKATFYRAFRAACDMTPSEYRSARP